MCLSLPVHHVVSLVPAPQHAHSKKTLPHVPCEQTFFSLPDQLSLSLPCWSEHRRQRGLQVVEDRSRVFHTILRSSSDDTVQRMTSSSPGLLISVTDSHVSEPGLPRGSQAEMILPVPATHILALLTDFSSWNLLTVCSSKDQTPLNHITHHMLCSV